MSKKKYLSKKQQREKKQRIKNRLIVGGIVLMLFGTIFWRQLQPDSVSIERQMEQPIRGNPDALVSIEIYSDFGCPACQTLANSQMIDKVLEMYDGQVNAVWRDFPVIAPPRSIYAAEAGQCAQDQGLFWAFHDITYARAEFEDFSTPDLRKYASQAGLDMAAYDTCLDAKIHVDTVEYDLNAARDLGLRGTPALVINGQYLYGALGDPSILINAVEIALAANR